MELLEKVVTEHPNTPWADLASREISAPFGFKWVEFTLPPPPKPMPGNNNNAAPRRQPVKPKAPPIKL
jgi:CubicO group peptidase (beta-lactamase class C family)